ncbi:HSP20 family protein [Desulfovibrionales bacterium]
MVIDFSPFYNFCNNVDQLPQDYWISSTERLRRKTYPLLNISDSENALNIYCELPGVELADIEITLTESTLSIKGERKPEKGKYYRQERPSGIFQRLVTINAPIERNKVTANLKNGLLVIVLPKSQESLPRKISIQA